MLHDSQQWWLFKVIINLIVWFLYRSCPLWPYVRDMSSGKSGMKQKNTRDWMWSFTCQKRLWLQLTKTTVFLNLHEKKKSIKAHIKQLVMLFQPSSLKEIYCFRLNGAFQIIIQIIFFFDFFLKGKSLCNLKSYFFQKWNPSNGPQYYA